MKHKFNIEPPVCIILINFNNASDTINCLKSIKQLIYTNFSIVVCDNSSNDNSFTEIQSWGKQNLKKILYLKTKNNKGFAAGNNLAIKQVLQTSAPEYVWLLNNDCTVDRRSLQKLVAYSEKNKNTYIIGSTILDRESPHHLQVRGGKENYIYGTSMLIRSSLFNIIGYLDEKYFMLFEDADFCLRARNQGLGIGYAAKSIVYHRRHGSSGQTQIKHFLFKPSTRISLKGYVISGYYFIRNNIYYHRKFHPFLFPIYLLLITLFTLPKMLLAVLLFDDHKIQRIALLFKGFTDGINNKLGKTIDPAVLG